MAVFLFSSFFLFSFPLFLLIFVEASFLLSSFSVFFFRFFSSEPFFRLSFVSFLFIFAIFSFYLCRMLENISWLRFNKILCLLVQFSRRAVLELMSDDGLIYAPTDGHTVEVPVSSSLRETGGDGTKRGEVM